MTMIEVKTADLIGPALDWAVAKADGWNFGREFYRVMVQGYRPSTEWAQCGHLIEKYKPWLSPPVKDPYPGDPHGWDADIYDEAGNEVIGDAIGGPTALVAVCRAVVSAKLGDVVSVPAELVGEAS